MNKVYILIEEGDCDKNLFVFKTKKAATQKVAELKEREENKEYAHDELKEHCKTILDGFPKTPYLSYEDKKKELAAKYDITPDEMPDAHSSSWYLQKHYWIEEVESDL